MNRYLRWLITYGSGMAEGEIIVNIGVHHWPAWPGTVWLLLPAAVALAVWVSWKD